MQPEKYIKIEHPFGTPPHRITKLSRDILVLLSCPKIG